MKIRWMVWILLFALLVVLVTSKRSRSSNSRSSGSSHQKDTRKTGTSKSDKSTKGTKDDTKSDKNTKGTKDDTKSDKNTKGTKDDKKSGSSHSSRDRSSRDRSSRDRSSRDKSSRDRSSRDRDDKEWIRGKPGKINIDPKENEKFKKGKEGGWRRNKDRGEKKDYGCECSANGDPHFTTCDGEDYDFQGGCTYTLAQDGCGGTDQTFEVLISTEPWKKSKATVTKEVRINLFRDGEILHKIKFARESGVCEADDVKTTLPRLEKDIFEAIYSKGKVIFELLGHNMKLEWNYDHNVKLSLGDEYKEGICGLCGNYNGKRKDDFILSDGSVVDIEGINDFGESWRAAIANQDEECQPEVKEDVDPCNELSETKRKQIEEFCGRMRTGPFAACYSGTLTEKIDRIIKDCIFDYCLTPASTREACQYAEGVANDCGEAGYPEATKWQTNDFCGENQCKGGKVFRENYLGDRSCSNPSDEPAGPASSGCFCPDNFFLDGSNCVTIEGCGCSRNGYYLKRGEELVVRKCNKRYRCNTNGDMEETDYSCDENARCKGVDGKLGCVCKTGYEGDGQTCTRVEDPNTIGVGIDGELDPSSFTSSSQEDGYNSWDGRLDGDKCWKPQASDQDPWLQVSLLEEFRFMGIRLQACPDGDCSVTDFALRYSTDGVNFITAQVWNDVEITGDFTDFMLDEPADGVQYIKIHASNNNGCVGLRMEVIGERSNCPTGYHPKLRSCYMYVKDELNWWKASQFCRKNGGYLVEIFNQKENDYINKLSKRKEIILGINDAYHEGSFINEHGSGLPWLNFPADHEIIKDNDCVIMNAEGSWYNVKCWRKRSFVCESGGGNDCPDNWRKIGGGCYKLIKEKLAFADANDRCLQEGGHLVEITSPYENKAVSEVSENKKVWIAVSDVVDEGQWLLFPSQRLMSFTSWAGHEPNDWASGEDCAITNWGGSGMWNDVPCDGTYDVVCERGQSIYHQVLDICDGDKCNGGDCLGYFNYAKERAEFVCKCKDGKSGPTCNDVQCNCFAWGDPHFGTCDGLKYDYQGKCSYVMAQDGCNDVSLRTFQIVVSTQDFPKYPGTTSIKTIYIYLDYVNGHPTTILRLDQERKSYRNDVLIDGDFTLASKAEVYSSGGKIIFKIPNELTLSWNGDKRIDIKMEGRLHDNVCGMCGNFNGESSDDIADENNNNKLDKDEIDGFGNLWSFGEVCAAPETPEPIEEICAKASDEIKNMLEKADNIMNEELYSKCKDKLGENTFNDIKHALMMDFCPTGDKQSYCDGMTNLVDQCRKAGYFVCFENIDEICDYEVGENEEYVCGIGGELRCGESKEVAITLFEPVDGIFCKTDYFRLGTKCVKEDECGCKYQTAKGEIFTLKPDEVAVDSSCTTQYSCTFDDVSKTYELKENPRRCHTNAECFNGVCECGALFKGSGYECTYDPGTKIEELEGIQLGVSCDGSISKTAISYNPPQEVKKAGRLCEKDNFFIAPPEEEDPYIEVDLTFRTRVVAIITRGWFDGNCWPASVSVWYSNDRETWDCAKEEGSEECMEYPISYQRRVIPITPLRARYVQIRPRAAEGRNICLQVDLFGGNEFNCPKNFEKTPTGCYRLVEKESSYEAAASFCAQKNGYLVEISSKRENRVVRELAGERSIFLGLRESGETGIFINPKGSPNWFSNFADMEPDVMKQTARCITSTDGKWYRTECSEEIAFVCESGGDALNKIPAGKRLGIEFGGKVPESALTASSFIPLLPPSSGRLFTRGSNAAWSPLPTDEEPYIQVDLGTPFEITAIVTQGRGDADEYTQRFTITYSYDCEDYKTIKDEADKALDFNGNSDQNTQVLTMFEEYFNARCVRIYPQTEGNEVPIALRFELYGIYIIPDAPCMTSLLQDATSIPDTNFVSSSCEQLEEDANQDINYCASFARLSDDNDVWWSPGADGHYQFIQVYLEKERIVSAVKLVTKGDKIPAFRMIGSSDGIHWECIDYKDEEAVFPEFVGSEHVYELLHPDPLIYIRINPVCEGIPELKFDVLGCDMQSEPQN